jgi:hypothetical protein
MNFITFKENLRKLIVFNLNDIREYKMTDN